MTADGNNDNNDNNNNDDGETMFSLARKALLHEKEGGRELTPFQVDYINTFSAIAAALNCLVRENPPTAGIAGVLPAVFASIMNLIIANMVAQFPLFNVVKVREMILRDFTVVLCDEAPPFKEIQNRGDIH